MFTIVYKPKSKDTFTLDRGGKRAYFLRKTMTKRTKNPQSRDQAAAFVAWLEENRGFARGTLRSYRRAVHAVLGSDLDPLEYLSRDLAPSYRHVVAAALRLWAEFNEDEALAAELATLRTKRLIRRPQENPRAKKAALSPAELEAFLAALGEHDYPPWVRPCLGLMAKIGLRANDLLRLSRSDVERAADSDRLRVVGKGEKVRWLPTSPVEDEIQALLDLGDDWDHVWDVVGAAAREPENRPEYGYAQVWKQAREVAEAAGIENMSTHRLRKSAARRLYETSGHDIARVTKLLGHSNPQTTMAYLEIDEDDWMTETGEMLK